MYFIYFVFVQVIPPIEFRQLVSKKVPKDEKLNTVVQQKSTKINLRQSEVYDLWYEDFTKMKFSDYEKLAMEAKNRMLKCPQNKGRTRIGKIFQNVPETQCRNLFPYTPLIMTFRSFLNHTHTGT